MDLMAIKLAAEKKSKGFGKYLWGGYQVVMGKAMDKVREAIERNNTLIGAKDFFSPKKKMESCISEALIWADEMIGSLK